MIGKQNHYMKLFVCNLDKNIMGGSGGRIEVVGMGVSVKSCFGGWGRHN